MSREALLYAGVEMQTGKWLMFSILNSLLLGLLVALVIRIFLEEGGLLFIFGVALVFGVAFVGVLHNVLVYYGGMRARQIEVMLPDALQLIAANIRADIPIHKSLLLAARPEFGLLANELKHLGNSILAGRPTGEAFKDFSKRVKSPLVTRIATLMEEGLRSGHNVAGMMDQVAFDIRAFKILDDEVKANIGSYVIFIVMAVLVIAPVLYSISISFIELTTQVKETLEISSLVRGAALSSSSPLIGLVAGETGLPIDTLVWFSAINLAASAGIAAVLISVLQTGETTARMPYILVFILVAETLFFISITVLRVLLGGFFA